MPLSVCINNDVRLNLELDSMADELSERYEELNLVYHTNDQVSFFREGHAALVNLVQNCADYLNVSSAMLRLADKRVDVNSQTKDRTTNINVITRALDSGLCDQVYKTNEPLIINGPACNKPAIPFKILAYPIAGAGSNVDGILVMINDLSAVDFTNSDKNLLSVMAKKAAKIIQGSYDGLTGLLNRRSFEHLIESCLSDLHDESSEQCILHVNVDKLHRVNDTLGHEAGDAIIEMTAGTLRSALRDSDVLARIGGDEIGILINDCSLDKGSRIAEKLLDVVKSLRINWGDEILQWTVSIGIAAIDHRTSSADKVMKHAVIACEVAKERGSGLLQTYGKEDAELQEREYHMQVVADVHTALRNNDFALFGQLIEPLKPDARWHVEVLLRMADKSGEVLDPSNFLPASERYQLMPEIDRWVVEQSFEILEQHVVGTNDETGPICGLNLSGQSITKDGFLAFLIDAIRKSRLPAKQIYFEITETAAVANVARAQEFIAALRNEGCRFALDDFGAGLSSFGYLKSFDVQYLKIDGALVRDICKDPVSEAMVASVHQIGKVMGLETIAEFVESATIRSKLKKMGVEYAQGYAISKPQPLVQLLKAMRTKTAVGAI
jgi:diguanylate cyclase (GGDEF)-like protein